MTLMLHVGAQPTDYDGLRALDTPLPTATHVPIPHFRVVDMLKHTLGFYGHEVTDENFGVHRRRDAVLWPAVAQIELWRL